MTTYRGFKYEISSQGDGRYDFQVWPLYLNARAVPVGHGTATTEAAAERTAKEWINDRQPSRKGGR